MTAQLKKWDQNNLSLSRGFLDIKRKGFIAGELA